MPVDGAAEAEALRSLLVGDALAGAPWFDARTHIGQHDPDGRRATPDEIPEGLERAQEARSAVARRRSPG